MRKKTQIINNNPVIQPRLNRVEIEKIKKSVAKLTLEHEGLLKKFNERYDAIFVNEYSEKIYIAKKELFKSISEFHDKACSLESEFHLDNFFLNDFFILKLKADVLLLRIMEVLSTGPGDKQISQSYADVLARLAGYLTKMEFKEDRIFQEEIYFCIIKSIQSTESQGKTFKNYADPESVFYQFSIRCSDTYIKFNLQFHFVKCNLLSNTISQIEKTKLSKMYIGLFESLSENFEKLLAKGELNFDNRIKYINSIFMIFKFYQETHPTLISFNLDKDFNIENKGYLKKIFKVHDDLKHTHIDKIVQLITEIDLSILNQYIAEIYELKMVLKIVFTTLKNDVVARFKWIKMLNCDDDKIELDTCRDTIVKHYKYVEKLYVFGNEFLKKYQALEGLFNPNTNFQELMQNIEQIDQVLKDFEESEIIRDSAFVEEKAKKMAIANEHARFLVAYEQKQQNFLLERKKKRVNKEELVTQQDEPEKKTVKQKHDKKRDKPVQTVSEKSSPFLDHAWHQISKNKYSDAIISYELALENGKTIQDLNIQMMALDGLSIANAHILLKELDNLFSVFNNRTVNSPPLVRDQRIDIEISIKNIIYKKQYVSSLYDALFAIVKSGVLHVDEESILFIQNQLTDLLQYVDDKIKSIQQKFSNILKQSEAERKAFILLLGKAEAAKLHLHGEYSVVMDLGHKKFIAIGNNKMNMGQRYSDHTNERLLLDELAPYITCLGAKCVSLSSVEMVASSKNRMVMGTFNLTIPPGIQDVFQRLKANKKINYLHGDALIDLIQKKYNLKSSGYKKLDFLSTCTDEQTLLAAGFKSCTQENQFFLDTTEGRTDLLTIAVDPMKYMLKRMFTISSLYCIWKGGDQACCYDLSGRGLRDLEQMRLVMVEDPNSQFATDPASILLVQEYCSKGFHMALNIVDALRNFQVSDQFDRGYFEASVCNRMASLDYQGRKKYVQWFMQYGMLHKFFDINFDCRLNRAVEQLEVKLGIPSVLTGRNSNSLYSQGNVIDNKSANPDCGTSLAKC